ncbi:hypothetical protein RhiJN_06977 [Ceratobasidium sp. AG-Ba]|nr:hypothetical protein RhiJN_06977 [Ceratobasidium sp. AG-Ba]QRW07863.1 hypothetical protein RhiLY_06862 [Ceratobasidium sp. AG-Ba]
MIVLPAFIAAFAAFINAIYLASHPDCFVSEMAAFTVLGASSSTVLKPATRVAIGYISSVISGHPTSFSLSSLVADNLSYRLALTIPTASRPSGWSSAAPVFFDRDARIRAGWDVYALSRLSAVPSSRLFFPSHSYFLRQESFLSGRHLVYDWVDRTYGAECSRPRQAGELTLPFGRCANSFGQMNGVPETDTRLGHNLSSRARSTIDIALNLAPAELRAFGFWSRVTRIPARPGSHSGVRFGWIMEVRVTVAVLISALHAVQTCGVFSGDVEMRPAKRLRLEVTFAMPTEDVSAHRPANEKSAVGAPPMDALLVSFSNAQVCPSDLLPGHAVPVAHKESAVVPLETESIPPSTSETPVALSGTITSAATLVLSQARGRLLLLQIGKQCDQDKIRARMLHAKRTSAPSRSASGSRELGLLVRRQKSGTMKDYQRHLVVSGQVLNLAIAHTLSSRQPPKFSGTPSLSGYSPGLQTIPESRRKQRERR